MDDHDHDDDADGRRVKQPRQVRRLSKRLDVARQLHDLEQDSALDIVDIERLRVSVTRCLWLFLAIGSAFTTTGVQDFLAGHLTPTDPVWWGCWGVEPCLVGILITILRWEAAMIARDIPINSKAVDWLKRFLLTSTLIMNVVPALWPREGEISAGMLAAHIMVPILVFFLAEVMPIVQARCTQARRAITLPTPKHPAPAPAPVPAPAPISMPAPVMEPPAPAPAPVSSLAEVSSPVSLDGLGIPTGVQTQIRRLITDLDRPVTAADVQQATRLPLPLAARVADRLTPAGMNGHAH
ncbi:hypothetical protein [Salinispora arenicola]|uniref:DUF2637 domain-containing protein n=1 Tax=Salinispora arenicola TaxID=168697 RepID=A0A542XP69_SALAC|nr:hypothetical protein [Salinispora arenicola]TQL37644.1 hypothetical protein FB564_2812 [Salinispora arenicola]GIM87895.1 hypothetical protein Sar04_46310 [Salinispora arenicola]